MEPFLISERQDSDEWCFKPLIAKNNNKTIVTWCYRSDKGSFLMMKSMENASNPEITTTRLEEDDEPMFLHFNTDTTFTICIETKNGYKYLNVNEIGEILSMQEYIGSDIPILPQYQISTTVLSNYEFLYNYKLETCRLLKDNECIFTFKNVSSIPVIIYINNGFLVSYLNRNSQQFVNYYSIGTSENISLAIEELIVEYLVGCQIDSTTCVLGGYSIKENTLKLNYYRITDNTLLKIDSYYWRSTDNKIHGLSLSPLNKGFLLLSESVGQPIKIQRFTHLGTWLYPPRSFDNSLDSWGATISNDFICYLKDGEVWGHTLITSDIPEIDHLRL